MQATAPCRPRVSELRPSAAIAAALGLALSFALLGGCALVDPDQARLCRTALPALEPSGTRIGLRHVRRIEHGVRITYRAEIGDAPPLDRFMACRFDPGLPGNLVGITTDRGEVAGATVYFLLHYYVDTQEGLAADPGSSPGADLPEWPPMVAHAAQLVLVGLPGIAVYGLLAAAYALLYGLVGRINLAFGPVAAVGAAAIGLVVAGFSVPGSPVASLLGIAIGLPVALASAAIHAAVAGHASFQLVPAGRTQASLIATVGIMLALTEWLRLVGGPAQNWISPIAADPIPVAIARGESFIVTLTPIALLNGAVGLAACLWLVRLMARSRFGRSWRAAADDQLAAALCGVDGPGLLRRTALLSGASAGLAGAIVAVQFGALGTVGGILLGLKALAAAILGGIGSVGRALLGGLAIGGFEIAWSANFPIVWRDLALYVVLVVAIVLRPNGLFSRADATG